MRGVGIMSMLLVGLETRETLGDLQQSATHDQPVRLFSKPNLQSKTVRKNDSSEKAETRRDGGIEDFDLTTFDGIWFEAATSLIPALSFEFGCSCTQAIYNLQDISKEETVGAEETKQKTPDSAKPTVGDAKSPEKTKKSANINTELNLGLDEKVKKGIAKLANRIQTAEKEPNAKGQVLFRGQHRCQRSGVTDFGMYIRLIADSKLTSLDPPTLENANMIIQPDSVGGSRSHSHWGTDGVFGAYRIIALDDLKNHNFPDVEDKLDASIDQTYAVVVAPPPVPLPLAASMGIWVLVRNPKVAQSEELWQHLAATADQLGIPAKILGSAYLSRTVQDEKLCQRFWKVA